MFFLPDNRAFSHVYLLAPIFCRLFVAAILRITFLRFYSRPVMNELYHIDRSYADGFPFHSVFFLASSSTY